MAPPAKTTDTNQTSSLGVYPGSFNPPTTGHLAIAEAAKRQHGLARIDLTVSTVALAKEEVVHPRFGHRIEVLRQAVAEIDWLDVVVTEERLLAEQAQGYDVLIVGADKWHQIQDTVWYDNDPAARDVALASLPTVAIAPRDGLATPTELTLDVSPELIEGISSTAARDGGLQLMVPAARTFAQQTGAWIDIPRYDRWVSNS